MAIVMALQHKSENAQSLADKFEVSRRTILRDMQSLSEMGVPLYSMSGPAGGFHLIEGYQLPPLQLDSQEAWTVLFALQAITKITDTPFNQARWTVMNKIKAVLPEQLLSQIEPMLQVVEVEVPDRKVKTPLLTELLDHVQASKWLKVLYRSEKHHRWIPMLPERIYTAHGFWYCEAYSDLHKEKRNFRVDRFEQIEVIEGEEPETTKLLSDSHLTHADKTSDEQSATRIIAKLTYRGALLVEQDVHIGERVRQISDDEWQVEFMCPAPEWAWAVRFFFSLGMQAEVIEPRQLQDEIYRLANQLCQRYIPPQ
jgi:predicted DNA-binding transcriptional regulator YafY